MFRLLVALLSVTPILASVDQVQDCEASSSSVSSRALLQAARSVGSTVENQNHSIDEDGSAEGFAQCIVRDNECYSMQMDDRWFDGISGIQAEELALSEVELVVARYSEDLRWLDALPQLRTIVYNRGGADRLLPGPRANLLLVQQPNVGREDEVFLHHIVEHYDQLPKVTVFLQGWPFGHCPGFLQSVRRAITAVLETPQAPQQLFNTAGFVPGLAPITGTFWQYDVEEGLLGLASQLAKRHFPQDFSGAADKRAKEIYNESCQNVLGGAPCPRLQWTAEGAQWAVSRERILSTKRETYANAMKLGEGWEGKFRGLVLEALWPTIFGARDWQPSQVEYLPQMAGHAKLRARSFDDYCSMGSGSKHLLFSCTERVEFCERRMHAGQPTSSTYLEERRHYEVYDSEGLLPWHVVVHMEPQFWGSATWWPRNSPSAYWQGSEIVASSYSGTVVEADGALELLKEGAHGTAVQWVVTDAGEQNYTVSRTSAPGDVRFLGCNGNKAFLSETSQHWELQERTDGWVRLFNIEASKYLSLDDRENGAFLYCLEEVRRDDDTDQSTFLLKALQRSGSE
ncbi:unnamed protein product [Effrenium voratum]|nr:unnamed protein product [Effrenium voratum]